MPQSLQDREGATKREVVKSGEQNGAKATRKKTNEEKQSSCREATTPNNQEKRSRSKKCGDHQ